MNGDVIVYRPVKNQYSLANKPVVQNHEWYLYKVRAGPENMHSTRGYAGALQCLAQLCRQCCLAGTLLSHYAEGEAPKSQNTDNLLGELFQTLWVVEEFAQFGLHRGSGDEAVETLLLRRRRNTKSLLLEEQDEVSVIAGLGER